MILVDKEIKDYVSKGELIVDGYQKNNVSNTSYDLTVASIYADEKTSQYDLTPGETVYIKTKEELKIPNDFVAFVREKNSMMRLGLQVDAPYYQPGHKTYAFLRVRNISKNVITIAGGQKIAQILFVKLDEEPEHPYDGTFQNETTYSGLGNYEQDYLARRKKYDDDTVKNIKKAERGIYANVLTLMGVFVAIFSVITINYQAFTQANVTAGFIFALNLSLAICIAVLLLLIAFIIKKFLS